MSQQLANGKQQFIDGNGAPLAGGSVAFYQPGTLIPVNTYQDSALTILNANPLTLDADGMAVIWGADGTQYRQIVKNSAGVTIWDQVVGLTIMGASVGNLQSAAYITAVDSGVVNAYAMTLSPAITSLKPGMVVQIDNILNTNTGASTLNVNALGALPVVFAGGSPMTGGELAAGYGASFRLNYAGTEWVLLNSTAGEFAPTATVGDSSTKVASTAFVAAARTPSASVRQAVLSGQTTNGQGSAISAGSGLAVNLAATATPMVLTAAQGFGAYGGNDKVEVLSADATGIVTIPANQTSYLYRQLASAWGSTLAPAQYGYVYNQSAQSSLTLNQVSTDDFGNSWSNNSVTFANTSPAIPATYYGVFNGTSSYMKSTAFTTLGAGAWSLRGWFNTGSLAAPQCAFMFANSSGYGVEVAINTTGKTALYLSSTGSSWDVASATAGSITMATGTSYFIELTYDPVAGKYLLYINGSLDQAVTSSAHICAGASMTVGATYAPGAYFSGNAQGFEFLPYCQHPAGTTYTAPTALSNVGNPGYASDWFDMTAFVMRTPSAASTVPGTSPTFALTGPRVYVGQAVTGASSVSSVTNYPYMQNGPNGVLGMDGLINNTNASSDLALSIGQGCYIDVAGSAAVPLHVATGDKQLYAIECLLQNVPGYSTTTGTAQLNPNNAAISGMFEGEGADLGGVGISNLSNFFSGFVLCNIGTPMRISALACTSTIAKTVKAEYSGNNTSRNLAGVVMGTWLATASSPPAVNTTTAWTSLGTLAFTNPATGRIIIRRLA